MIPSRNDIFYRKSVHLRFFRTLFSHSAGGRMSSEKSMNFFRVPSVSRFSTAHAPPGGYLPSEGRAYSPMFWRIAAKKRRSSAMRAVFHFIHMVFHKNPRCLAGFGHRRWITSPPEEDLSTAGRRLFIHRRPRPILYIQRSKLLRIRLASVIISQLLNLGTEQAAEIDN